MGTDRITLEEAKAMSKRVDEDLALAQELAEKLAPVHERLQHAVQCADTDAANRIRAQHDELKLAQGKVIDRANAGIHLLANVEVYA